MIHITNCIETSFFLSLDLVTHKIEGKRFGGDQLRREGRQRRERDKSLANRMYGSGKKERERERTTQNPFSFPKLFFSWKEDPVRASLDQEEKNGY